jgi:hypothetical protein
MTRAPGARFRKPAGQIAPVVVELDPLQRATLEDSLAWCRQGHQSLHEASRYISEAIASGQVSIAENAPSLDSRTLKAADQLGPPRTHVRRPAMRHRPSVRSASSTFAASTPLCIVFLLSTRSGRRRSNAWLICSVLSSYTSGP